MENQIRLIKILVTENKVVYQYEIGGDEVFRNYFRLDAPFQLEYDVSVESVPQSVLAVPFIGNMLGFALIFDAKILVPEIDADFYAGIPDIIAGYRKMYKGKSIGGSVFTDSIVKNIPPHTAAGGSLLFYGGGVDSAYSLIQHVRTEDITLFHIWGADILWDNTTAWENALSVTKAVSKHFGITYHTARSSLHGFFKEGLLNGNVQPVYHDNFWHGFQHSVGMLAIAAPLAWLFAYDTCLFASTFSAKDQFGDYTCASDPIIDNFVCFCGCRVQHDGYDTTRQEKIHAICQYATEREPFPLRVCFSSQDGENCCNCEKCTRTAFALIVEGMDPRIFGLDYSIDTITGQFHAAATEYITNSTGTHYRHIQEAFQQNFKREDVPKGLLGFYDLPFDEYAAIVTGALELKKRYLALKAWTDQLQEGKDWLEQHSQKQEQYIQELEERLRIAESAIKERTDGTGADDISSKKSILFFLKRLRRKHR